MRNFCTYFDKNYLLRGLALYDSLLANCPNFTLWILCMDEETHNLLSKMKLEKVRLIKLSDFEDEKLLAVKKDRSKVEYYWTCTPSLPLYVFKQDPNIETIAYLDADLFFYSSPEPIFEEFGNKSIMIIPHRYSEDQAWRETTSGTYNVSMLIFRNNAEGLACLQWWRERCLEWCKATYENGKLGDQMYLNQFPSLFNDVHVLKHEGANVAPWNIRSYSVFEERKNFYVKNNKTKEVSPLIFYHFHSFPLYLSKNKIHPYPIKVLDQHIYSKYLKTLKTTYNKICTLSPWSFGFDQKLSIIRRIKQYIVRAWI